MTDRPEIPENPETDPVQALWQGQEQESPAMTLQAIRMLARNDVNHVRNGLFVGFVLIAIEAVMFTPMVVRAQNDVSRAGGVITLLGLAWIGWQMWRRRPGRLPEVGATTGALIAFHRAALERRRTNYRWMLVTAAPLFVGVFVGLYGIHLARPRVSASNFAPVLVLSAVWFVAAWILQRRQARRLQEQIDELDQMSRGG